MALKGVLRPGYIQIRVTDLDAAVTHYVERIGLHEVSREADGRVYLRAWDEFDRHSIVLRPADMPGMDYAGFKVASESDLDTLARRIKEHGIEVEEIAAGQQPGLGRCELHRADRPSDRVVLGDESVGSRVDDQTLRYGGKNRKGCG